MSSSQKRQGKTKCLSLKKNFTENQNNNENSISTTEIASPKRCKTYENIQSTANGSRLANNEITLSFDVNSYFQNDNISQFQPEETAVIQKFQNNVLNTQNEFNLTGTDFQLTNPEWDKENAVSSTNKDDNLSQFYESSQFLNQIDSVISNCDFKSPSSSTIVFKSSSSNNNVFKSPSSSSTVCKSPLPLNKCPSPKIIKQVIESMKEYDDAIDDTISREISQLFKSSQYKREVSGAFNKLETTICQIINGQDENLQKDVTLNTTENYLSHSIINHNWDNDSIANITKTEPVNYKMGDKYKQTMLDNLINPQNVAEQSVNQPVLNTSANFVEMGPFYGLPNKVQDLILQYKGIDKLYDWQDECLKLDAVKNRKNLVYALPTSGGKTLVSEILIFREIMCRRKNAIFVLPYVSIVQEKVWALSPFALALNFLVEEYAAGRGTLPPRRRRAKRSVYIATIEKALGLVNALLEANRIDELGLVVIDELHLLGEQSRGAVLEQLLTKIMYSSNESIIHVVGMSATIGNLPELCKFLNAEVYTKNFRPVELKEYVKCGNQIYEIDRTAETVEESLVPVRNVDFNYSEEVAKIDPDRLAGLVMEVIPSGSCLVFCASKKNCENVALLLCRVIPRKNILEHRISEKQALLSSLKAEGALCPTLKRTIPFGIAYHHSGLTGDERRFIEDAFRVGTLCVICCTSTLAAGVNLPARRVILRSPYVGRDFLTLARYKQMSGRAGRAGLGEKGESILICSSLDLCKVASLLCSPMEHVHSRLLQDFCKGLRELVLSCIALETANTRKQLRIVTQKTLLAVQKTQQEVKKATDEVIRDLFKLSALQVEQKDGKVEKDVEVLLQSSLILNSSNSSEDKLETKKQILITNDTRLIISKLGLAAIKGGLDLDTAHILYDDLIQAQGSLVLLNCLHLLYLVTPYELSRQIQPSLQTYYSIYLELPEKELATARVLGLDEACCSAMMTGKKIKVKERILNRFYLTMILYELWEGNGVFEVADKYQVSRGLVQQLMVSAATFAANVVRFCEQMEEFWAFAELLKGLGQRLQHCAAKDLEPLMALPAVKQARARQLLRAGYGTLQAVAIANPSDMTDKIQHMSRRVANQLIASAKLLLLEKVENLREEAQDVLDGIGASQ